MTLIEKLQQTGTDSPTHQLAILATDSWFETPIEKLIENEKLVAQVFAILKVWSESPLAIEALEGSIERLVEALSASNQTLAQETPKEFQIAAQEILGRQFSPSKSLVTSILDTKPMRELIRQLLTEAISDFTKRASAPVQTVAKGLGAFARLAQDTVKNRGGTLGGLVGAFSENVEHQVEQRSAQFIDAAISKTLNQLADFISNQQHADEAAEIRVALFEAVMKTKTSQLSRELINLDVPGGARLIQEQLLAWVNREQAKSQVLGALKYLESDFKKTPKELLESMGLYEVIRTVVDDALENEIRRVFSGQRFEQWLEQLTR